MLQLVKSLPFHIPKARKRYTFRAESHCIGHCKEYIPRSPRAFPQVVQIMAAVTLAFTVEQ